MKMKHEVEIQIGSVIVKANQMHGTKTYLLPVPGKITDKIFTTPSEKCLIQLIDYQGSPAIILKPLGELNDVATKQ